MEEISEVAKPTSARSDSVSEKKPYISDEDARFVLAVLLWALVSFIVGCLLLREVPPSNREILYGLAGTIVGALLGSSNFYNKTGVGNDRMKDDTLNKIVSTAASIQSQVIPTEPTIKLSPGETATVAAAPENPTDGTIKDGKAE